MYVCVDGMRCGWMWIVLRFLCIVFNAYASCFYVAVVVVDVAVVVVVFSFFFVHF